MVHPRTDAAAHHAPMPTFKNFASWIQLKFHIARLDRSSRLDRDKYKPSLDQAHVNSVPKSTSSASTPQSALQTAQMQKIRSPMLRAQKSTPGGDKQYRDAIRNKRSPPPTTASNKHMPEEAYYKQNPPKKP